MSSEENDPHDMLPKFSTREDRALAMIYGAKIVRPWRKEREQLKARIAELEGENKRLRRVSSIASDGTTTEMQPVDWHKFAAYQKALDDVDRILDWRRDLILDCMCEEFISDKVEALRGGGE